MLKRGLGRFGAPGERIRRGQASAEQQPGFWKVEILDEIGQLTRWMGSIRRLRRLVRPFSRADGTPAMAGHWRLNPGEGRSAMRKRIALNNFG